MADVHVLSSARQRLPSSASSLSVNSLQHFGSVKALVSYFFQLANLECDAQRTSLVVLGDVSRSADPLDRLSTDDKILLFRYFFNHLNVLIVEADKLDDAVVARLNRAIAKINALSAHRISRIELRTGTSPQCVNDAYLDDEAFSAEISFATSTMASVLSKSSTKSISTESRLRNLIKLMNESIDVMSVLSKNDEEHLSRLALLVGHWAFPSHELSVDDLAYCVYLMLDYALRYIKELGTWEAFPIPSANELLLFVLITRDNYQHGNPFHNFRHAVDVMQACFYYLVKLECLPKFAQFRENPKEDELVALSAKITADKFSTTLDIVYPLTSYTVEGDATLVPHLNPIQSFGLLLAALGHDVGHPGVTNAFLINHEASPSQIYNEISVLESYHTTVFINRICRICLQGVLSFETDKHSKLTLKRLIIGSILATDMAEHFEYIDRLKRFRITTSDPLEDKVKLISSLLIKCADISNVTRPLRVSSQWALLLSREFAEIETLEKKLANEDVNLDVDYEKIPTSVKDVLTEYPLIHKGQLFFINTFAEGLFGSISDLLPELKYTSDIVMENKKFWIERDENLSR